MQLFWVLDWRICSKILSSLTSVPYLRSFLLLCQYRFGDRSRCHCWEGCKRRRLGWGNLVVRAGALPFFNSAWLQFIIFYWAGFMPAFLSQFPNCLLLFADYITSLGHSTRTPGEISSQMMHQKDRWFFDFIFEGWKAMNQLCVEWRAMFFAVLLLHLPQLSVGH